MHPNSNPAGNAAPQGPLQNEPDPPLKATWTMPGPALLFLALRFLVSVYRLGPCVARWLHTLGSP